MEESRVELSDLGGGGGDVHGLLTTAEHDMVELGRDGGAVDGSVGLVGLEALQRVGVVQLGAGVLRGGDEHGAWETNRKVNSEKRNCATGGPLNSILYLVDQLSVANSS